MNREDALKKIKKCLVLGRSAEPHEAAAAMRQAQKLMAEFAVSERDLSLLDVGEVRGRASSVALNRWEARLAGLVADAFGCERFTTLEESYSATGSYVRKRFYVFVGLEAVPTVAGYTFEVLSRQCAKARLAHIGRQPGRCKPATKTARGDEFAKGWVLGVSRLVERFAGEDRRPLLLEYLAQRHPDMATVAPRDSAAGRRMDAGHVAAGFVAGQQAELRQAMQGRPAQERLA